jgi:hypothetical protein
MRKNVMRHLCASAIASGLIAISTPAAAADYLPTGVQTNVSISTVLNGGWSQCFSTTYGSFGASLSGIASACTGSNMMLAARATGSDTLLLLAQALESDVMFDTGTGNVTHNANGVEWYFNDSYSWGFANGGQTVFRTSCDTNDSSGEAGGATRLCWHTSGGTLQGGWRAGDNIWLNDSSAFERLVFTFNGAAVPEPSTWAMMLLGFGGIGFAMRRRRKLPLAQLA